MIISKERLLSEAEATGFRTEMLEKAILLLHLLEALFPLGARSCSLTFRGIPGTQRASFLPASICLHLPVRVRTQTGPKDWQTRPHLDRRTQKADNRKTQLEIESLFLAFRGTEPTQ